MNHRDTWEGFAARIRGLMEAARFHASLRAVNTSDSYGRHKVLAKTFARLRDDLIAYRGGSGSELPAAAQAALQGFIDSTASLVNDKPNTADLKEEGTQALLLMVAAFETEMTFLLSDHQEAVRSRADRAFEHLQRMIVVDEMVRAQWQEAHGKGEVACERRGGVHLLLHGIWAFKADAAGARTDLVYQEPINDLGPAQRAADGLVLTEWKAANPTTATAAFVTARAQGDLYRQGALAGFELTRYRYAIVVSESHVPTPGDLLAGEVTWRHINIAVNPETPSREARKHA